MAVDKESSILNITFLLTLLNLSSCFDSDDLLSIFTIWSCFLSLLAISNFSLWIELELLLFLLIKEDSSLFLFIAEYCFSLSLGFSLFMVKLNGKLEVGKTLLIILLFWKRNIGSDDWKKTIII